MKNRYPIYDLTSSINRIKKFPRQLIFLFSLAISFALSSALFAQAPILSYGGPQTYIAGNAITPLTPISSGIAAPAYSDSPVNLGSGFNFPHGVAVDATGNVYVADNLNNAVKKIPVGGGAVVTLASDVKNPNGVAVDGAGNVFFVKEIVNSLVEIRISGKGPLTLISSFQHPGGVAVDAAGNLFIGDAGNNAVKKLKYEFNATINLGSGFNGPQGVAVDSYGNIYVADVNNNAIKKIPFGGGATLTIASGFSGPQGVAVDAAGNVYVADYGSHAVKEIPAAGGAIVNLGSGFIGPNSAAIDGVGNLYISDDQKNTIEKISPTGGYFINPTLPAGLSFNSSTGAISGAPTAASPATNYTITAYNAFSSVSAIVNITVDIPPIPVISYPGPKSYIAGVTITPLAPVSTGVTTTSYSVKPVLLSTTFFGCTYVAVDTSGNSYVADGYDHGIYEVSPGGDGKSLIYSFTNPTGVAINSAGTLYVSDGTTNTVYKIPARGSPVSIGSSFNDPQGIAVDAAGNVYVAENGNHDVLKIPAAGGTPIKIASGFTGPYDVAVDASGNIFVADGGNAIKEIPVAPGPIILLGSGFNYPVGVAVDVTGNVFVADYNNQAVYMIPVSGGAPVTIGSGLLSPYGVTSDGSGNVYVTDNGLGNLYEIKPLGGYYLNVGLPAGLKLNNNTGAISGEPVAASPATTYKVTAYNPGGSAAATVNLSVITNGTKLSNLTVNNEILGPTFSPDILNYLVTVKDTTQAITITPTAVYAGTTITVNGKAVSSGSPSAAISLVAGNNTINILLTAADGVATNSYNVLVYRKPSISCRLGYLEMSAALLSPKFDLNTTTYSVSVGNTTFATTVTPTTIDSNATITVNGLPVLSGTASQAIILKVGLNPITIVVTAQNGLTTDTYTITVNRKASISCRLGFLEMSAALFSPKFDLNTNSYSASIGNFITSTTVTPTTIDSTATITVNGLPVLSGKVSSTISLNVGLNTIIIVVTAQDGVTTDIYTVNVTRAASPGCRLITLEVTGATISPVFNLNTTSYSATVSLATSSITITPTNTDPGATIAINGTAATSGAPFPYALAAGLNTISLLVTAQNGINTETYTITVNRVPSTNAGLSALELSSGTLTPAFSIATTNYTALVANTVTAITLTPTTADITATVEVNGTAVTSGTSSGAVTLNVGNNVINTVVTAQDGTTSQTYTVTVTRAPSTNAYLSYMRITGGGAVLSPNFTFTNITYAASVPNTTASVTVTPTTYVTTSTQKVNGIALASGTTSPSIPLSVDSNTIDVVVTAQDGVTTLTYTITVTRAPAADNSLYQPLSVADPLGQPQLTNDGILVHQGLSPNGDGINDFLQIDGITNYPDNKLLIMNRNGQLIFESKNYDNSTKVFDGHSDKTGAMQLPGTYYYSLDYTVKGVVKRQMGFIVLKY